MIDQKVPVTATGLKSLLTGNKEIQTSNMLVPIFEVGTINRLPPWWEKNMQEERWTVMSPA